MDKKIEELLSRGVEKIYPSKEALQSQLESGKKLKIYTGFDPTGKLHIGHSVIFRKLRQFQDLGHEIIVLIGDFTARIGDPTDKSAARKKLSKEEVEKNAANYKQLIAKILDLSKANVRFLHNEEWTNKLKPVDLLELASHFTVSQLLERDMFQERIKAGKQVYLHEFWYPVFQAYDSVTMDVDMEIGGNDQTFNMLAGRTLMKKLKNKEKFVLAMKLLTDPNGKKMSKSEGNVINLDDSAEDIFGKVMAFPDDMIEIGFELLTDFDLVMAQTKTKNNPRDAKVDLAFDIVRQLKSEAEAEVAKDNFESVFSKRETPENIEEFKLTDKTAIIDLIVESKIAESKSQARRLVEQGAVRIDGETVGTADLILEPGEPRILKVGKLKFLKIV